MCWGRRGKERHSIGNASSTDHHRATFKSIPAMTLMKPHRFSAAGRPGFSRFWSNSLYSHHLGAWPSLQQISCTIGLLFIHHSQRIWCFTDDIDQSLPEGPPTFLYHGFRTLPQRSSSVPDISHIQSTIGIFMSKLYIWSHSQDTIVTALFCKYLPWSNSF